MERESARDQENAATTLQVKIKTILARKIFLKEKPVIPKNARSIPNGLAGPRVLSHAEGEDKKETGFVFNPLEQYFQTHFLEMARFWTMIFQRQKPHKFNAWEIQKKLGIYIKYKLNAAIYILIG